MKTIFKRNLRSQKFSKGFTLVELLIVIGLLGAIALIVISAINPIEQANRARDTRFKADASQLISAIDRYFAARSEFPWVTDDDSYSNDSAYGFITASDSGVGLCDGTSGCGPGLLITSDELKTEFTKRDFIKNGSTAGKQLLIGKAEGTSESVYACFIPLSKSTRQKAVDDESVYTIDVGDGTRTQTATCDADNANWVTSGCYICVPE